MKEYKQVDNYNARRWAQGDTSGASALVLKYNDGLVQHCAGYLNGDMDLAQDAAQNAWIKAHKYIKTFDPELGRFSTWLFKIGRNTSLTLQSMIKREQTVELTDQNVVNDNLRSPQDVEDHLNDLFARAGLDDTYLLVFRLKFLQGYSTKEIAERIGRSESSVWNIVHRTRKKLKAADAESD